MKYIEYDIVSESKYKIKLIHYKPELLTEEDKVNGVLVEVDIPQPTPQPRKTSVLYYNPVTNKMHYEYIDRELTEQEKLEDMKLSLQNSEADTLAAFEALAEVYEMLLAAQPV